MPNPRGSESEPRFFTTPAKFRAWLERHHATADELWVGFFKKGSGHASITYPESLDAALCYGWIDGVRKSIDEDSYRQRFTPRRRGSNWSAVNVARVEQLRARGLMHPSGEAAYAARDRTKAPYSFEQESVAFTKAQEKAFRAHAAAWKFFQSQPPGYRRTATWWVVSAKREETRARRLATLIADSAAGLRIALLRRDPK